jgi:hypothetical protein
LAIFGELLDPFFGAIFLLKKQGICDRIFYFSKYFFSQNGEQIRLFFTEMAVKLQIGDRQFSLKERERQRYTHRHTQTDGLFAREQMESCRILSGICIVYSFIGIAIGDGDFMAAAISSAPVSTPQCCCCCCCW